MMLVTPIVQSQQEEVVKTVNVYRHRAASIFEQHIPAIDVRFDLKGRAAGMYCCRKPRHGASVQRYIRFNPWLFAKYPEDSLRNTIPHEVAHYVSDIIFGLANIKPHGKEWRDIMLKFGSEPKVRGDYSLEGIPVKQMKRFAYACACREVALTHYRHKKVQQGVQSYRCRDCLNPLVFKG